MAPTDDGIQDFRPRIRRGIVYDKWPFRLDIETEYQDWILVAMCFVIVALWTMPCVCGRIQGKCARNFSAWVYTRLHIFYWFVLYFTLLLVAFTIGVLPDWTVDEFLRYLTKFTWWVLGHLVKMITNFTMMFVLVMAFRFRERVLTAAGLDHIRFCRWNWTDPLGLKARRRPMEIFIWKVEGLNSSVGKVMKANDVYLECHLGDNEVMCTRVHNNAGRGCIIKESFQINIDESNPSELMHILVKDQSLVASSEVARLVLSIAELCGIEDQTGKRRSSFTYSSDTFLPLSLSPTGLVWIAAAPVDDRDVNENSALVDEDGLPMTC